MTRDELIRMLMDHRENDVSVLFYSSHRETEQFMAIPAHSNDIKDVRYDSTSDRIVIDVEVYGLPAEELIEKTAENETEEPVNEDAEEEEEEDEDTETNDQDVQNL